MTPVVNSREFVERIRWLRARAEETRTIADEMEHSHTRITMLQIAETYDKVAEQLEKLKS